MTDAETVCAVDTSADGEGEGDGMDTASDALADTDATPDRVSRFVRRLAAKVNNASAGAGFKRLLLCYMFGMEQAGARVHDAQGDDTDRALPGYHCASNQILRSAATSGCSIAPSVRLRSIRSLRCGV